MDSLERGTILHGVVALPGARSGRTMVVRRENYLLNQARLPWSGLHSFIVMTGV